MSGKTFTEPSLLAGFLFYMDAIEFMRIYLNDIHGH